MGVLSNLLDIFYPPKCIFCRKFLKRGERFICNACKTDISYTKDGGAQSGDFFSVCISPLYYEDKVRDSILRFKFKEATGYAKPYGELVAECIKNYMPNKYDLISWVPLSKERYKERGYDQAMLLALAVALEMDDVAVSTLEKYRDVEKQSNMGSAEKRRANISGVYRVSDAELIADKRILLIDDIVTTGSTLSECARTLLQGGAKEVMCATIARAKD